MNFNVVRSHRPSLGYEGVMISNEDSCYIAAFKGLLTELLGCLFVSKRFTTPAGLHGQRKFM
eukprot:1360229-Pyramimonas_sp.AAC.1